MGEGEGDLLVCGGNVEEEATLGSWAERKEGGSEGGRGKRESARWRQVEGCGGTASCWMDGRAGGKPSEVWRRRMHLVPAPILNLKGLRLVIA